MANANLSSDSEFARGPRDWSPADDESLERLLAKETDHPAFGGASANINFLPRRRALGWALTLLGLFTLLCLAFTRYHAAWLGVIAFLAFICGILVLIFSLSSKENASESASWEQDDGAVL